MVQNSRPDSVISQGLPKDTGCQSKKALRERENIDNVGGMRRPARSLNHPACGGLRTELLGVRGMLQGVLHRHPDCIGRIASLLGKRAARAHSDAITPDRGEFPEPALREATQALKVWSHAAHTRPGEHTPLRVCVS